MRFESSSMGTKFWPTNCPPYSFALLPGYSQWDMDMGEILLKYPLQTDLRLLAGVDITDIKSRPDKEGWYQDRTRVWEC